MLFCWMSKVNSVGDQEVWTGTNPDGTSSLTHCGSWGVIAASGDFGVGDSNSSAWTLSSQIDCAQKYPIYCFEVLNSFK
jgi:hypothetical protein